MGYPLLYSKYHHALCPNAVGKTTVAKIYGQVLKDLSLLSKGDVVVKVPADFIGSVLGESEKKTMGVLEEARGCVLVIDEAYGLHSGNKSKDPYKVGTKQGPIVQHSLQVQQRTSTGHAAVCSATLAASNLHKLCMIQPLLVGPWLHFPL